MGNASFERKGDDQGTPGADREWPTRGFKSQNLGDTGGGICRSQCALSRSVTNVCGSIQYMNFVQTNWSTDRHQDSIWTGQTCHTKDFAVIPIRSFLRILLPGQVQARLLSSPRYPRFGNFVISVWVIRLLRPAVQTLQLPPPHHVCQINFIDTCP